MVHTQLASRLDVASFFEVVITHLLTDLNKLELREINECKNKRPSEVHVCMCTSTHVRSTNQVEI